MRRSLAWFVWAEKVGEWVLRRARGASESAAVKGMWARWLGCVGCGRHSRLRWLAEGGLLIDAGRKLRFEKKDPAGWIGIGIDDVILDRSY